MSLFHILVQSERGKVMCRVYIWTMRRRVSNNGNYPKIKQTGIKITKDLKDWKRLSPQPELPNQWPEHTGKKWVGYR